MKIKIIICLLTVFGLAGCRKDIPPVLGNPDERQSSTLTEYEKQLTGAVDGWVAYIFPAAGGGYSFYMDFSDKNEIFMLGDLDDESMENLHKGTWRTKASQQPLLNFDTYSYLHKLSDPNGKVFNGVTGQGYKADFEFAFISSTANSITLKGKLNNNDLLLVRASKEEADAWKAGKVKALKNTIAQHRFISFPNHDNGSGTIGVETKTVMITYGAAGNQKSAGSPFAFTPSGIRLQKAITFGGLSFTELKWDGSRNTYYVEVNGTPVYIAVSATPLFGLGALLGYNNQYTTIEFNGDVIATNLSSDFASRWAQAWANTKSLIAPPVGRMLIDYAQLKFLENNEVSLTFRYKNPEDGILYTGTEFYSVNRISGTQLKLQYLRNNGNALVTNQQIMRPVTHDYLGSLTFNIDWVANPDPNATYLLGGLYAQGLSDSFFYGVLK